MEVDGISVTKAQAIENASVISGYIAAGTGHLILVTKGGTEIDAGAVKPDPIDNWPIGSVYMGVSADNPATLLGGGTWIRWGQGRVPVSQDGTQTEFDTVEETGGSKTVTLTEAQMPTHNHPGTTSAAGQHSHHFYHNAGSGFVTVTAAGTGTRAALSDAPEADTELAGTHSHTVTTDNKGSSAAHPNLQPYIVCYMWKRTA